MIFAALLNGTPFLRSCKRWYKLFVGCVFLACNVTRLGLSCVSAVF